MQAPERGEPLDRGGVAARRRREDAPAADEQLGEAGVGPGMLRAGDRMGGHEVHAGGNVRRHCAQHRAFDRADVGYDRARRQMRADLGGDRAAGADRNADDDEIGAFDGRRIGFDHLIGEAELGHPPAGGGRAGGRHDRARGALRARGSRDRGADQAHADQREAVEDGVVRSSDRS